MEDVGGIVTPTTDDDDINSDVMRVEYIIEDDDEVKEQQDERQDSIGTNEVYLGVLNSPSTSSEYGNNGNKKNNNNNNNSNSSNKSNRHTKSNRPGRKTDRQRIESGQRREWTDSEILQLIQLWRENDILYNTDHSLYYVQAERKLALDNISNQLQISLKDVTDKMHSLRTYYCSQRQRMESINGGGGGSVGEGIQVSRWKFYDQMSFLYESVTNRAVKSSLTGKSRRKNSTHPSTVSGTTMVIKTEPSYHTGASTSSSSPSYELQETGTDSHVKTYEVGRASPVKTYQVGRSSPLGSYEVSKSSPISVYESSKASPLATYEVGKSPPMGAYEAVYAVPYEDSSSTVGQSDNEQHHLATTSDYRSVTNEQATNRILIGEDMLGKRRLIETPLFYPVSEPVAQSHISSIQKPEPISSGSSKSDAIFGEMVADSLSQIEDEQQKELLKLNIQTLIYNVRFRRNNTTTQ